MSINNHLESLVQRIERLEEEKAGLAEDIKSIYSEAKSDGYDPKILKQVIALRKKDASKVAQEKAILATYMEALGMLADLPLGKAALKASGAAVDTDFE